uniref:Major facilitator superfamily (MFS) profile domain-containing protein n=1 Tax=Ascaris lumbricoides TaxID=6252 RepID=A0A9J2P4S9_ASCLU
MASRGAFFAGVQRIFSLISVEPALALYIFTSFIKYPVFQALLYEKSCVARYHDAVLCGNTSAVHSDIALQKDANQLFLYSSLCLLLPSIPTALLLGSLSDVWSAKIPILIPLLGLIIGDVNYVVQSSFFNFDARWLLLSDIISGFTGGYAALMGMMFSCSMKQTDPAHRSRRMALLEGSIGIGATLGFSLAGLIRESLGFSKTFILLMGLRVICFIYIVAIVNEIKPDKQQQSLNQCYFFISFNYNCFNNTAISNGWGYKSPSGRSIRGNDSFTTFTLSAASCSALLSRMVGATSRRLVEVYEVMTRSRPSRSVLLLVLVAFAVELLAFAGVNDIQYSFFRFKLKWTDKEYGWYKGLSYAFSTVTVLSIYPWMKSRGVRDMMLCAVALTTKIVSLLATAFVFADWFAYATTPLSALNRFIATSLRATASQTVDVVEQGKVFSVMSLTDGVTSVCGSVIFNSLYPRTLPSLSFLCFVIVAAMLLIPLFISLYLLTERAHTNAAAASNSEILNENEQ